MFLSSILAAEEDSFKNLPIIIINFCSPLETSELKTLNNLYGFCLWWMAGILPHSDFLTTWNNNQVLCLKHEYNACWFKTSISHLLNDADQNTETWTKARKRIHVQYTSPIFPNKDQSVIFLWCGFLFILFFFFLLFSVWMISNYTKQKQRKTLVFKNNLYFGWVLILG